jgi:hypothetical protein
MLLNLTVVDTTEFGEGVGVGDNVSSTTTQPPSSTTTVAPTSPLALRTGIRYQVFCEAVQLLFVRDPFTVSVKYKNGNVVQWAELIFWDYPKKMSLTSDMVELTCSDHLWDTNQVVNASIPIVVKDADCDKHQFKW